MLPRVRRDIQVLVLNLVYLVFMIMFPVFFFLLYSTFCTTFVLASFSCFPNDEIIFVVCDKNIIWIRFHVITTRSTFNSDVKMIMNNIVSSNNNNNE